MSDVDTLREIVKSLRQTTKEGQLNKQAITNAIGQLSGIARYNSEKFPRLANTDRLASDCGASPKTVAEALLWKLGKWKVYRRFVENYNADKPVPTSTDVVLYAFVKHLKNNEEPIYDQHALRALWAIDTGLSFKQEALFRSVLVQPSQVEGKSKWKESGSGSDTRECFEAYRSRIASILPVANEQTLFELDQLLMPLGQALKRATRKSFQEFCVLCDLRPN